MVTVAPGMIAPWLSTTRTDRLPLWIWARPMLADSSNIVAAVTTLLTNVRISPPENTRLRFSGSTDPDSRRILAVYT